MPDLLPLPPASLPGLYTVPSGPGPHPVLCFLHGYDEAAPLSPERGLTRHGPLRRDHLPIAESTFLVVAPQLTVAGDRWHRHADDVASIVDALHATHGGDPARTYLTGFSFGGNGVFDLALLAPDRWAALWAVDPTRVPEADPGLPTWLSSGEISRSRAADFIDRLGLEQIDDGAPATRSRVYLDEGYDHVGTAAAAYGDRRIYGWLLAHRR